MCHFLTQSVTTAALIAVACLLASASQVTSAAQSDLVLVERTVDSRLDRSESALSYLLSSALTRKYRVEHNDTLQGIASKLYSLGPSTAPAVYEKWQARVCDANHLSSACTIRVGQILELPDLPPLQLKLENPDNPFYSMPRTHTGPSYADALKLITGRAPGLATKSAWRILDAGRKAAPFVNQSRWITLDQARAEHALPTGGVARTFWSQPITLRYQATTASSVSSSISSDVDFLASLLKRKASNQDSVLYVLDDSWPSQEGFNATKTFLVDAIRAVRTELLLGPLNWPTALTSAKATTNLPFDADGRVSHAREIERSLAPFTALGAHVKVVYLPLFTEQTWAKEVWNELAFLTLVADSMKSAVGKFAPSPDITDRAKADANSLISLLPLKIVDSDGLGPADQTSITVLAKFAELYSEATRVPYFLSMSWTVEKYDIAFALDPDSLGLSLAAAGNDDKDVIDDGVYMASRAKASPGDIVAVMNSDHNGSLLCHSGKWSSPSGLPFYGLGYDGVSEVSPGTCGTSFSTPRVAWLLALRQSFEPPIPDHDRPMWFAKYRQFLYGLQEASKSGYDRYWLSVPKLFSGL